MRCTLVVLDALLALLLFVTYVSGTNDHVEPRREAYVSLLYGNTYTLAVRVMMQSLVANSPDSRNTRERIVLQTGDTSQANIDLLENDGVRVIRVPTVASPYVGSAKFHPRFGLVMTKLVVFNMTEYTRILFIDADSLVLKDLSPLFSCARFCAAFINPCYFNSGLMLVSPNATMYNDMSRVLPHTSSYDGGDQGFLNEYFPEMLQAPLFHPDQPMTNQSFARFPFSFHTDHSAYYNRLAFTFEDNPGCGPARDVEWLGPPFMKPWIWWGYAIFDLSWVWYNYRQQVENSFATDMHINGFMMISVVAAYLWLMNLYTRFESSPWTLRALRAVSRLSFYRFSSRTNAFYLSLLGILVWGVTFFFSVRIIPTTMPPLQAFYSFAHVRAACNSLVLLFIGALCLAQTSTTLSEGKLKYHKTQFADCVKKIVFWSVTDAVYLVIWDFIMWKIKFPSIWGRIVFLVFVVASQLLFTFVMLLNVARTCMRIVQDFDSSHGLYLS
ncbi:Glycosyl transferase family GT8 [Gracilaria domingensis]|nr:Glycosyl transferase family GT8 [Gracilaria domingensis]